MKILLNRSVSTLLITVYGLGTILGAGIYALVGVVARESGVFTPIAFIIASVVALFTAVSYAELSSRYPESAGESYYVRQAFSNRTLATLVGWAVIFTGIVSSATLSRAMTEYSYLFVNASDEIVVLLTVFFLSLIAAWGMRTSAIFAAVITIIEMVGLLWVIILTRNELAHAAVNWQVTMPTQHEWVNILMGAYIAFYAYIGFEDMVNVAEEVKNPRKSLPIAIFFAITISTVLYTLVSLAIVTTLSQDDLVSRKGPLAILFQMKGIPSYWIGIISLIAMINGALVQIIMSSRVIYGLAKAGGAPKIFNRVNSYTRTPLFATLLTSFLVVCFALCLPLVTLAKLTTTIILSIFILINISLIKIKLTTKKSFGVNTYPIMFPIIGLLLIMTFIAMKIFTL